MKRIMLLLSSVLLLGGGVFFTACSDSDDNSVGQGDSLVLTDRNSTPITEIELPGAGCNTSDEYRVYVATNGSWNISWESRPSWCTTVQGSQRVTLHADINLDGASRQATMIITTESGLSKSVTVIQPAYVSPYADMDYDYMLGTFNIGNYRGQNVDDEIFTVTFSARETDYVDANGASFRAYDITGWGKLSPDLHNGHPATAIYYSDDTSGGDYIYILSSVFSNITAEIPDLNASSDGSVKQTVTADYYFSGNMLNVDNQEDTQFANLAGMQLYIIGIDKETDELFVDYFPATANGSTYVCMYSGYWYLSGTTFIQADSQIIINSFERATQSVKMMSSVSKPEFTRAAIQPMRRSVCSDNLPKITIEKIN